MAFSGFVLVALIWTGVLFWFMAAITEYVKGRK